MEAAELMNGRAKQAISIIAFEIEGVRSRKTILEKQQAALQAQMDELELIEQVKLANVKRIQDYMSALELTAMTGQDIKELLVFEAPKKGLHREVTHSTAGFSSRVLEDFLKSREGKNQFSRDDVIAGLGDKIPAEEISQRFSQRAWYLVNQGRARSIGRGLFAYQG